MTDTSTSRIADAQTFLDEARTRYQVGLDADAIDRTEAEADNRFANSSDLNKDQWAPIPLKSREDNHRPVLQWNRLPTYLQQVSNDGRMNKPAIKISQGDGGSKETAEFFQARIRHVEYESNADIAYDTTRDQQTASGRGFLRVFTEDIPGKFQQRVCIEAIENQFSVVFDPSAKKYDRSDADYCFVVSRISKDKFERDYGKRRLASQVDWDGPDNPAPEWIGVGEKRDQIQIAEYWVREYRKRRLVLLSATDQSGDLTAWEDEVPPELRRFIRMGRDEQHATVYRYVIDGAEILEEGEWIGSRIPIVPVWGREAVVQGIRRTFSLIRQAKDPQRLVNLYVSNIAEQIAMMPKAPYEAPVGSIAANHEADWRDAGLTAKAVLYYLQYDEQGRPFERPSRIVNEPPIQALSVGLQQAIDGIKSAMGIFDASLGARSNETSGVAIERRKKSAEIVNFHFPDNEARSRKAVGEILIEILPLIDKPGMRVATRSEDGKTALVPIGKAYPHPKTGEPVTHILTDGDYGVTVSTGASYESRRQEINERDQALIQAWPDLMMVIGDLYFSTDDAPGAEERAERMKHYIQAKNPGVIQDQAEQKPLPPGVQQQIAGLQQELQTTQAFAQSLHQKLETEQPKLDNAKEIKRMELDFEREKLQVTSSTQLALGELKAGVDADLEVLRQEIARINTERGIEADKQARESEQQHAAEMADKTQAGALEQQQQAAELAPQETTTK